MLRLARTPKWIGLGLIALAVVVACILLGRWQYEQTFNIIQAERFAQSQPVDVEQAVTLEGLPDESIGRPVTASGTYLAAGQVAILQRSLDNEPGVWILTPLELSSGAVIGVLRGWLPSAQAPGAEPLSGRVEVAGLLHPDEPFYADAVNDPGTALAVSSTRLRQAWGPQTLEGFIMLTEQRPVSDPGPLPVPATVQTADVPFPLRNFVYAFQWWVFAAFALVVYGRWLWLDARPEPAATVGAP
jgi:cytochrome oxidase assembly protein ShyY1